MKATLTFTRRPRSERGRRAVCKQCLPTCRMHPPGGRDACLAVPTKQPGFTAVSGHRRIPQPPDRTGKAPGGVSAAPVSVPEMSTRRLFASCGGSRAHDAVTTQTVTRSCGPNALRSSDSATAAPDLGRGNRRPCPAAGLAPEPWRGVQATEQSRQYSVHSYSEVLSLGSIFRPFPFKTLCSKERFYCSSI